MTWIRTVPTAEADDRLREALDAARALYPVEYATQVHPDPSGTAGIIASHSLFPEVLKHAFSTFGALMSPDLPLARRHHEMIATRVSTLNRSHYCMESHAEFLRRVTIDEELVRALVEDYDNAALEAAERAMLDYVGKVTVDATTVTRADHDQLRRHGFDDRGILQITLVAAFFAYVNRAADALGVGRD